MNELSLANSGEPQSPWTCMPGRGESSERWLRLRFVAAKAIGPGPVVLLLAVFSPRDAVLAKQGYGGVQDGEYLPE